MFVSDFETKKPNKRNPEDKAGSWTAKKTLLKVHPTFFSPFFLFAREEKPQQLTQLLSFPPPLTLATKQRNKSKPHQNENSLKPESSRPSLFLCFFFF